MSYSGRTSAERPAKLGRRATLWLAGLWAFWLTGITLHGVLRGLGDEWLTPVDVRAIEAAIFFVSPPEWLQQNIQRHDIVQLDYLAFLNHVFWFPLPLLMALALTRKKPAVVGEFFAWIVTLSLLTAAAFVLLPVIPPWMEGSSTRVLVDRAFTEYTSVDNNAVAAFPSMHAALPALMGLFFWTRCREDGRPLAWLCVGYAGSVGLSVVYLGEHWVIDVLAGYAFAGAVAWAFVTGRIRRATRAIPGDPVGRLIAVNERLLGQAVPQAPELEPVNVPAQPDSLPRAA